MHLPSQQARLGLDQQFLLRTSHQRSPRNQLLILLLSLSIQASLMQPSFSSDANSSTCIALCLQADVIPTCRELGIGIVAYSPLGRGFLTGTVRSIKDLHETDWRVVRMPRFQGENLEKVRMLLLITVFSIDCHHHHHSGESRPQWYPFDPVMCCC